MHTMQCPLVLFLMVLILFLNLYFTPYLLCCVFSFIFEGSVFVGVELRKMCNLFNLCIFGAMQVFWKSVKIPV